MSYLPITQIIKKLLDSTISEEIDWKVSKSLFNNDTCKQFECEFGGAKFKVEIHLDRNSNFNQTATHFWIYHPDLNDGSSSFTGLFLPDVYELGEVIFKKYVKNTLSKKDENQVLENILNSFTDKSVIRDQKINSILTEETNEKKKTNIIKRLFQNILK